MGTVDLYPVLKAGANMRIIEEHLPPAAGPLYAKHHVRGRPTAGGTALYYRLYRWLKNLETKGYLTSSKGVQDAGLGERPQRWWSATPQALGLIRQVQSSNRIQSSFAHGGKKPANTEETPEEIPKWLAVPQRCSSLRVDAIKAAIAIKTQADHYMFVRPDRKKEDLHPDLIAAEAPIRRAYESYIKKIDNQRILLVDPLQPAEYLILPYRTRFNDRHRQLSALDKFEADFQDAEKYYDSAVFLTLTTAPAMHPNLWWANRHMSPAFNRYMALLTKRNISAFKAEIEKADAATLIKDGWEDQAITDYQKTRPYRRRLNKEVQKAKDQGRSFRPRYICCNEFQKNGLIHSHIMIFGTTWLDLKTQIEADWERCGQGQIIDVYAVRHRGGGWQWASKKKRPKDSKPDEDAKTYLKKYLNKAIYDRKGFEQYFTINKRFFTASRNMAPTKACRPALSPAALDFQPAAPPQHYDYVQPDPPRWIFGGVVDQAEITSQLDFVAQQCRRKYCRPHHIGPGPAPVPAEMMNYEAATAEQTRRYLEALSKPRPPPSPFVRASALVHPETGRPWNLADFM